MGMSTSCALLYSCARHGVFFPWCRFWVPQCTQAAGARHTFAHTTEYVCFRTPPPTPARSAFLEVWALCAQTVPFFHLFRDRLQLACPLVPCVSQPLEPVRCACEYNGITRTPLCAHVHARLGVCQAFPSSMVLCAVHWPRAGLFHPKAVSNGNLEIRTWK